MKTFIIIGILTVIVILLLALRAVRNDYLHPYQCSQFKIVDKILSDNYRDATIQFTDGSSLIVNQATVAPGDNFCVNSVRNL
jgi:hypothetical protein